MSGEGRVVDNRVATHHRVEVERRRTRQGVLVEEMSEEVGGVSSEIAEIRDPCELELLLLDAVSFVLEVDVVDEESFEAHFS